MTDILVVDDEESIRFSFNRILSLAGYNPVTCSCSNEVKKALSEHNFEAAVIDRVLLEGENGLDIAKMVKSSFPFCEVILMSAYPTFESAAESISNNLFSYIEKPLLKEELLNGVEDAVKKCRKGKEKKSFKEALELIFYNSPEGILIFDSENSLNYINKTFKSLFDIRKNYYNSGILRLLKVKGFETDGKDISLFFSKEILQNQEVEIETEKRKPGRFIVNKFHFGKKGQGSYGFLISFRDITEKKELEKRLDISMKMGTIGHLAGGIAHDFNNILHVITGYAELTLDYLKQDTKPYSYVDEILNAADRGKNIAKQVLSFSKKRDEKLSPIKIQPYLKEVIKFLRSTIPSYIKIEDKIDNKIGSVISASTDIHQIIMNLVTNSQRAMMDSGGKIVIGLGKSEQKLLPTPTEPYLSPDKEYAKIFVKDTGVGISPENLKKIFKPFFTTREDRGGTGIGLPVVYGIVKKLEGRINVDSVIGEGTLFEIFLPIAGKVDNNEKKEEKIIPKGSETILIVDDEESIIKVTEMALKRFGYEVVSFTDSLKAIDYFLKKPENFDLIITDMTMPNLKGDELALIAKGCSPNTPVILTTGYSENVDETTEITGIDKIIMKPVVREKLALGIREVLGNKDYSSSKN